MSRENRPQKDYESIFRNMIRHEDTVTNYRIIWFVTLQGLLFSALGFAWGKPDSGPLLFVTEAMGLGVCGLSFGPIRWGTKATTDLRQKWLKLQPSGYEGPGLVGYRPEHIGWWTIHFGAWWDWLPVLFALGWIAIMTINATRGVPGH